jgi:para-aminobenzoate synthetase component 1
MKATSTYLQALIQHFRKQGAVIMLESQKKDHPASEKSYLAALPSVSIWAKGSEIELDIEGNSKKKSENPWVALAKFRTEYKDWLFGYFGYDLKNQIEVLHSNNLSKYEAPDFYFMIPSFLISWDKSGKIELIKGVLPEIKPEFSANNTFTLTENTSSNTKNAYLEAVRKSKEHIKAGDYYEINLSYAVTFEFDGDGWNLYQKMKEIGPVPFAAYVALNDLQICCASPERFLSKKGRKVTSQPIKGTTRKAEAVEEEKIIEQLTSEKNKAENLMIVDLVRNDLHRVAQKNSVQVKELFEIQKFSTVYQLVSTIECMVEEKTDPIEIIKHCFPMGSMTGAPKIAAMHSIEELENHKRGIYSGAIGYFTPWDDFDLNVVIRTAIIQKQTLTYPVGGAITSDSEAEEEWEETLIKTEAIRKALN